ncbi:MAG: methyltransferase domain-containing protein [Anaerolineales bacterium]|jgi:ubiquinone/menaquinone biosynthesis C-methylase UbiE
MRDYEAHINRQYGRRDLGDQLLRALRGAGKDIQSLTRDDVRTFEEFHLRGRGATRELARLAKLQPGMRVLDIGSGVGGPARTLAAEFGCQVTGIDLSRSYCQAAEVLTTQMGLSDKVNFRHANALDMPFEDRCFEAVWMQHVLMNIEPKARFLQQVRRVLRDGGVFAFHEVLTGSGETLFFPLPWANHPDLSFMVSPEELREMLAAAGLEERAWIDETEEVLIWGRRAMAPRPKGTPAPLGLDLVIGPDCAEKTANLLRNLEEGRVVVVQAVFVR